MRAKALCLILVLLVLSVHIKGQGPATTEQAPSGTVLLRKTVAFVKVQYLKGSEPWEARGTGFFVFVEDKRIGDHAGFIYLVTNRHVAEPEENGQKFRVLKVPLRLNLKHPGRGSSKRACFLLAVVFTGTSRQMMRSTWQSSLSHQTRRDTTSCRFGRRCLRRRM